MKTTVDLPEEALAEAMKHAKAKTKTEAVARAVADFNQRHRLTALTRHFGTFKDFMTQADLKKMREAEGRAYLTREGPKGSREKFQQVLAKIPDVEPEPHDKLS